MRMTMLINKKTKKAGKHSLGFTLVEAVVSMAIAGIAIAALMAGFSAVHRSAESSAYSLAANALAVQGYERVRGARWDALSFPAEDQVVSSNFPPSRMVLDVASGTNVIYATNYTTITTISTTPMLKSVRIDCVYPFANRGFRTNSLVSYRAAETGQQNAQQSTAPAVPTLPPTGGTGSDTNSRAGYTYVAPTNTSGGGSGSWNGGGSGGQYGNNGGNNGGGGNNKKSSKKGKKKYDDDDDDD